ncbi:MAG: 6-bladed beta-propeller [Bacteroidales bacterium]|jgi:hypothetical protein
MTNFVLPPGIKLLISIIIIGILTGCSDPQTRLVTISIEDAKFIEIRANDLQKEITLIPLETLSTCMIGAQYMFLDGYPDYYILDQEAKQVFRFGSDGNFLNTIGKRGKGPGEYNDLYDGIVTKAGVELLTGFPKTEVSYFAKDGSFIKNKRFLEYASLSFIMEPTSDYYKFYGSGFANKILLVNKSTGEKVDSMLLSIPGSKVFRFHPFTQTSIGTILFCESIINKIYEIKATGIEEKYRLDFGKSNIEQDLTNEEFIKKLTDAGIWFTEKVLENDNYLYLSATKYLPDDTSLKNHFIYRKKDKAMFRFPDTDSFSSALGVAFQMDKNNNLFLPLIPYEAANSKAWTGYFEANGLKIKADDNPVVVKMNIGKSIK